MISSERDVKAFLKNLVDWLKLIGIVLAVLTFASCCYYLDHVRFTF